MKYKIEIWRFHSVVDVFEHHDINEILRWYKYNWQFVYDNGGCTFYLFKNDKKLTFDETHELGFYDDEVE